MTVDELLRLRELERRLQAAYNASYRTILRQERRTLQALLSTGRTIEAGALKTLVDNISADLANTAELARRMIDGESLAVYKRSYHATAAAISSQVGQMGMSMNFRMIDHNALNAIFNGAHTAIGGLQGYSEAFRLVGARQIYDRQRSKHVLDRAAGRLGNKPTLVKRLQHELAQSVILGEDVRRAAKRIQKVANVSKRQSLVIARTELLRASSQGSYLSALQAHEEYDIPMERRWLATGDERTRDSHEAMNGELVGMKEKFSNGLFYPRDPNGAPEETIQCRCVAVHVVITAKTSKAYDELVERVTNRNK